MFWGDTRTRHFPSERYTRMLVYSGTCPRRITCLLALLPSSLAVVKYLHTPCILPLIIASCLLRYPLIRPQFRSYPECKTYLGFLGLLTPRVPLRLIFEAPRCVMSVLLVSVSSTTADLPCEARVTSCHGWVESLAAGHRPQNRS